MNIKMPQRFSALAALAVVLGVGSQAHAGLVYFSTSNGYGDPLAFESLNTSTGAVNVISSTTPVLIGLQNVNGQIYGEGYSSGQLYQVNTSTGATIGLGVISGPFPGVGATTYVGGPNGLTYEFNGDTNSVYTLTPPSSTTTQTTLTPFSNSQIYAVRPDGQIYGIAGPQNGTQTLDLLNPTTSVLTVGATLSMTFGGYTSLFFDGSSLDVLDQNGLYTINTTTGTVTQDFAFSDGEIGQVWSASELVPATVPEPSSLALCVIGGTTLALAARRWRRGLASPSRRLV